MILGKTLALHARNRRTTSDVVRTRVKMADLPTMDVSRPVSSINVTDFESHEETIPTLDKRVIFHGNWHADTAECYSPATGAAPISPDCRRVCNSIAADHSPTIIGPLEIEHWQVGLCIFEVANLLPCDHIDILHISQFTDVCDSMLRDCVLNGLDGFMSGHPPPMAFALSGLPAAPPYHNQDCR